MKKVVILTASTGGGHNKVAKTIKEELVDLGYEVEVVDFLKNQMKIYELVISHGYDLLASRFPTLYGELYKFSNNELIKNPKALRAIRLSEQVYTKKMVKEYEPDLIVTTHPFAAASIGALKCSGKITQPVIAVVTDFITHKAYANEGIDHYVVGSPFTKMHLIKMGINDSKIHATGIPVAKEFYEISEPKNRQFTTLVMGGSMGLSQMREVAEALIENATDSKLIIVTGNNKELYESLLESYGTLIDKKVIELYGYSNEVHKLMDRSHLIVTKPGGLTVSESIIKELPLIVPFYIPGQEYENLVFLSTHGAAIGVEKLELIPLVVQYLQENESDYKRMKDGIVSIKSNTSRNGFSQLVKSIL